LHRHWAPSFTIPSRDRLRAVIGATHGKPIVISDGKSLLGRHKSLDEEAILALLDRNNVGDRITRQQQVAALSRAYRHAVSP